MAESVAVIHRVLSGGSTFPSVVETAVGRQYVLKLSGAGSGKRALATEFIALRLAKHAGLNVPRAEIIDLPQDLPWQAGTDKFYETLQRSTGPNLGVSFIANAADVSPAELQGLPQDFLARIAAVDALLQNVDRRAAHANIMRDATGTLWAIDFGACLLIERLARGATELRVELPPNHFLAGESNVSYRVARIAAQVSAPLVTSIVAALPEGWLVDLGLSRHSLEQRLLAYIETARAS